MEKFKIILKPEAGEGRGGERERTIDNEEFKTGAFTVPGEIQCLVGLWHEDGVNLSQLLCETREPQVECENRCGPEC